MDRGEEALAVYGELQDRFGSSESLVSWYRSWGGQVNRAATLFSMQRRDEALKVCAETWDRFGTTSLFGCCNRPGPQ